MSDKLRMALEFSRDGGWKEAPWPPIQESVTPDAFTEWAYEYGYILKTRLGREHEALGLTIYESCAPEAEYQYIVHINSIDGIYKVEVLVRSFPDLLKLAKEVYPLWRICHASSKSRSSGY